MKELEGVSQRGSQQEKDILYVWAEALYDHQEARIRSMDRIRGLIRRKLEGLGYRAKEDKKEIEIDTEGVEVHKPAQWTDKEIFELLDQAEKEGKINSEDASYLIENFGLAESETIIEKQYEGRLKPMIEAEKIWTEWLCRVKGVSTRNTTRLLKWFGYCERFDTVSKLWAYAGLAVKNGKAEKREKGKQLSYNLKIKTAMLGVLGDSLIKASASYKRFYNSYKKRV